ncbi:MAG: hypothetical protein HY323_09110 [Betaproteobacteria bacterium]|nr:hypothetical protein [Betaproteobacteria bacterium]
MPWPKGKPRARATRDKIAATTTLRHKAAHTAYIKEWQARNPGKTAFWKLKGQRDTRLRTIEHLGRKCRRCGFEDWRALQIDHVNGDGRKDRERDGNRYRLFRSIIAHPEKYQLLCANCNWIKRYENGEHNVRHED